MVEFLETNGISAALTELIKNCIAACDKEIINNDSWDVFNKGRKEAYEHILREDVKNDSKKTS